jgi:plasmid stabilization system protein ParE
LRPLILHRLANNDIDDAVDYYAAHAPDIVDRFLESLRLTMTSVQRTPRTGSPSLAEHLAVENLRFKTLGDFPYSVFYLDLDHAVRVVRVLHHRRDVMQLLDPDIDLDER